MYIPLACTSPHVHWDLLLCTHHDPPRRITPATVQCPCRCLDTPGQECPCISIHQVCRDTSRHTKGPSRHDWMLGRCLDWGAQGWAPVGNAGLSTHQGTSGHSAHTDAHLWQPWCRNPFLLSWQKEPCWDAWTCFEASPIVDAWPHHVWSLVLDPSAPQARPQARQAPRMETQCVSSPSSMSRQKTTPRPNPFCSGTHTIATHHPRLPHALLCCDLRGPRNREVPRHKACCNTHAEPPRRRQHTAMCQSLPRGLRERVTMEVVSQRPWEVRMDFLCSDTHTCDFFWENVVLQARGLAPGRTQLGRLAQLGLPCKG